MICMNSKLSVQGKKIRELRKAKGLSSDKLAEIVGTAGAYIREIELGKSQPSLRMLEKIAQALGVSVAELLTSPEEKKDKLGQLEEITDTVLLPVYRGVPAGPFREISDAEIVDYLSVPRRALKGIPKDYTAWIEVIGDSMSPEIEHGDLVLVADGSWVSINNGDRVIAILDGEATLKRFYDKGDYIILQPINHNYEPMMISKEKLDEMPLYLYKVLAVLKRY